MRVWGLISDRWGEREIGLISDRWGERERDRTRDCEVREEDRVNSYLKTY